jgi:hypothetical protein
MKGLTNELPFGMAGELVHLVLIETSGNQKYLFSTNRLRESVGASQLTYASGTLWLADALRELGGPELDAGTPRRFRDSLTDSKRNPRLETEKLPCEVILATSGKVLLLVREEEYGKNLISILTRRALREAPGMDLRGVVGARLSLGEVDLEEKIKEVHHLFSEARSALPGPASRFLRLPIIEDCPVSGLPASGIDGGGSREAEPVSAVSLAKRNAYQAGWNRIRKVVQNGVPGLSLARSLDRFEDVEEGFERASWMGIVHADGNGLGSVFMNFGKHASVSEPRNWRGYFDKLRRFSLALEEATENAFGLALQEVFGTEEKKRSRISVLPLVLGGDDLTLVCDGRVAVPLAKAFLLAFERETGPKGPYKGILASVAKRALGGKRIGSCAGVAVTKPHFPFYQGYELAEALVKSAKQVKQRVKRQQAKAKGGFGLPCSALDYHVHHDSSGADLDAIRNRLRVDQGRTCLHGRPYVLTPSSSLEQASVSSKAWSEARRWEALERGVSALQRRDKEGRLQLSSSLLHTFREALFEGKSYADGQLRLVLQRHKEALGCLVFPSEGSPSLFRAAVEGEGENVEYISPLLDAMDLVEIGRLS